MGKISKKKNSAITLGIFVGGFVFLHLVGRHGMPLLMYTRQSQPVSFSHAIHGRDVGISCETCHFFYADGSWSGIPTIDVCANCHSEVLGESEAEKHFVENYVKKDREVEWGLYFRQPQCVSFSHSSHVRGAELACETCHGPQGLSDQSTRYLTNRVTKYSYVLYGSETEKNLSAVIRKKRSNVWGTMGMNECAECHRARGTSTACFICHR